MPKHYTHVACTPRTFDWIDDYVATVPELISKHGGRYLYRSTEFDSVEMPNAMSTTFMVLIEWPDPESAASFYDDPDYQTLKQARMAGSDTRWFNIAESTD
jgi:uncharacterized protein (DUF1330 family)